MRACGHGFSADLLSVKTASYAVMHLLVAMMVAYALTLDWRKALAIGIIEPFVQTFAFALPVGKYTEQPVQTQQKTLRQ